MLFSQQVEASSKGLARRELRTVDTRVQRMQGIQQLSELYEQLGHPGQLSLGQMARQVRQELMSATSLERLLTLTGGDPARTHVVLEHVTVQARTHGRERDAARAQDFQEQIQARYARQIQAGVNIARALETGDAALRQSVRAVYYASVVLKQSLVSITQAMLQLFGEDDLDAGLRVMGRALADDIAAHRPSVPTPVLQSLLLGLQGCSQLSAVLYRCRQFVERLPARAPRIEPSAVALLQRLLGYAGSGIDAEEIQELSRELGGEGLSCQLVSLNQVYPLIQSLPLAIWSDADSRQEVLQSFLDLMGGHTLAEGIALRTPRLSGPIR